MRVTPENITELKPDEVFVFGSNLGGRHYGGAAKLAHEKFGAEMGKGMGMYGQSFAIPTMDTMRDMRYGISIFLSTAKSLPEKTFYVTAIGCGIAGFNPKQIAPMFKEAIKLPNVYLPKEFWDVLNK